MSLIDPESSSRLLLRTYNLLVQVYTATACILINTTLYHKVQLSTLWPPFLLGFLPVLLHPLAFASPHDCALNDPCSITSWHHGGRASRAGSSGKRRQRYGNKSALYAAMPATIHVPRPVILLSDQSLALPSLPVSINQSLQMLSQA